MARECGVPVRSTFRRSEFGSEATKMGVFGQELIGQGGLGSSQHSARAGRPGWRDMMWSVLVKHYTNPLSAQKVRNGEPDTHRELPFGVEAIL